MSKARITPQRFATPVNKAEVEADWDRQGFGCDWYMATPARRWIDCIHKSNALVVIVNGRVGVTVDGERATLGPGEDILIPRGSVHDFENVSADISGWLYGFDIASEQGDSP